MWRPGGSPRRRQVRAEIESPDSNVFVSAVTGWEIAIKRALGKLEAPDDLVLVSHDEQVLAYRVKSLRAR